MRAGLEGGSGSADVVQLRQTEDEEGFLNRLDDLSRSAEGGAGISIALSDLRSGQEGEERTRTSLLATLERLGWERVEARAGGRDGPYPLAFTQRTPTRYRFRRAEVADGPACRELFQRVFGQPATPALWSWKYEGQRGVSFIALRGDQLVAHYGGISRRLLQEGRAVEGVQFCDVMVDARERGRLTRRGVFHQLACVVQESLFGYGRRHAFSFGFPNDRHQVLGVRSGLYAEVERMVELRWSARQQRPRWESSVRPVTRLDAAWVEPLWQSMASEMSERIVGVRDAAYLRYRYQNHPRFDYQLYGVTHRFSGQRLGLLVLRKEGELCRLIDLVAPRRAIPGLVFHARRLAADWGCSQLVTWMTSHALDWFVGTAYESHATEVVVAGTCYVARVPCDALRNRWWLMMGDTDFM